MNTDLILDMEAFDFSKIDSNENETVHPNDEDSDFDTDMVEDGFDDEDFYDEDFEDEDGDNETPLDELSPTELAAKFSDIPDDIELMIGDVKATKADLVNHIKEIDDFKVRKGQLDQYFQSFESIDKQLNDQFIRAYSETEMKINSFKNKLRNPDLLDSERGMIYRDLEKLENNRAMLNKNVEEYHHQRNFRDEQAEQVRLNETNMEMSKRYGKDWATKMAPAITNYVVESGLASPEIRKALSPALLEMMIKAQKYDNLAKGSKEKVKAKVNGTARSTSSNTSKRNVGTKANKNSADLRKYHKGQLTGADAWHLIKD